MHCFGCFTFTFCLCTQSNLVDTEREKQLQHTDFEIELVLIALRCIVYMPLTIDFKHGYLNTLSAEMQLVLWAGALVLVNKKTQCIIFFVNVFLRNFKFVLYLKGIILIHTCTSLLKNRPMCVQEFPRTLVDFYGLARNQWYLKSPHTKVAQWQEQHPASSITL